MLLIREHQLSKSREKKQKPFQSPYLLQKKTATGRDLQKEVNLQSNIFHSN